VGGALAEAVAAINAAGRPVLALDVPTGLDSDTGEIRGIAVEAHGTISFVGLKTGLYLGSGPACAGVIGFSDLGLPAAVYADAVPALRRIDRAAPARLLRPRSRTAHKGLNGRVLVVGGAMGMAGAARLAAEAALRSGAGLVHAAVAPGSVGAVMAGRPEIMCRGVEAVADFSDWIDAADVIVLGPGLGRTDWSERLASALLDADKPAVVDADALHYLAQHPTRREDWVLTPHPGEAGALLDWSAVEVQSARERAVVGIAARFGGIAVLKGACSLIAQVSDKNASDKNKHPVAVCDRGNPGMASGGMGDVLSGVVAGLIAQYGLSAPVVECAVLVHARAGDDAAAEGERGLVASDLFLHLRRQVNPH
jgi:NAD(P)H-hydrate epimerase